MITACHVRSRVGLPTWVTSKPMEQQILDHFEFEIWIHYAQPLSYDCCPWPKRKGKCQEEPLSPAELHGVLSQRRKSDIWLQCCLCFPQWNSPTFQPRTPNGRQSGAGSIRIPTSAPHSPPLQIVAFCRIWRQMPQAGAKWMWAGVCGWQVPFLFLPMTSFS